MRILIATVVGLLLVGPEPAAAQVRIRAPFVRVDVNGGVHIRAPFVNLFVPSGPRMIVVPPQTVVPAEEPFIAPPPSRLEERPEIDRPAPKPAPLPPPEERDAPPPAVKAQQLTLEEFARNFKPRAGSYEIEVINPVTNQPTTVRFTLPEGTPRRVHVSRREIEFDYGALRYVKIQFDSDGAVVISR